MADPLLPPEWLGLAGGALLGAAVAVNRRASDMQTGVGSALKGALLQPSEPDSGLKLAFVAGVCAAGWCCLSRRPPLAPPEQELRSPLLSGGLVGFGVSMANGCTAGHGISGLSRGSVRSAAAVASFMAAGIATARVRRPGAAAPAEPAHLAPAAAVSAAVVALGLLLAATRGHPLLTGLLFGTGLVVSGMADHRNVLRFLQEPFARPLRLPATMGAAVLAAAALSWGHAAGSRAQGGAAEPSVGWRLLVGSGIFGIGWGLSGVCPGPSLVLAGAGVPSAAAGYVPALLAGMQLELWSRRLRASPLIRSGPYECHLVHDPPTGSCTYLLADTGSRKVVVVDPVACDRLRYPWARLPGGLLLDAGFGSDLPGAVRAAAEALCGPGAQVPYAVNTHVHADRLTGSGELRGADTRSVLSAAYPGGEADVRPGDGDSLWAGGLELRFLATPGHTEGCMSVHVPQLGCVLTGDALLVGGFGRTDMQGGSAEALLASGRRLLRELPPGTAVLPAHEYADPNRPRPPTLAEQARGGNPLLAAASAEELLEAQRVEGAPRAKPEAMDELVAANLACGVVPDSRRLRRLRAVRQSSSACG